MFNTYLYEPMFNALFFIYHLLPGDNLGLAIILLTIIIRAVLFIPSLSSIKSQRALQETQPKIEEIRKRYKDNKEEMARQLMKIYKDNKVNPFSSCLPLIIQLPILIALYQVFIGGLKTNSETGILIEEQLKHLYPSLKSIFVTKSISTMFLGFDLAVSKNYIFAVIAGVLQFFQTKMLMHKKPAIQSQGSKDESAASLVNKQMMYMMPVMTVIFGIQFPAGLTLYWIMSTVFTIGQQWYFLKFHHAKKESSPAPQK